jgi:hypothetical protein
VNTHKHVPGKAALSLLFHVTSTRLMEMPYDTTRVARSRMYGELARNLNDSDADI